MSFAVYWLAPLCFALAMGGFAWIILRAVYSGADAASGTYSDGTSRQMEDMFLFIPPKRLEEIRWTGSALVFILVFLLLGNFTTVKGFTIGFLSGLVASGLALYIPNIIIGFLKKRRLMKFNLQLVDTLVNMSNSLKAGFSIAQAIEAVVRDGENPIAQEFGVFLQQTRVGVSFSDALQNMEERMASEDLTLVVAAIETARKTGGNLTEILESISSTIRERMRIENRIRTLTSQGRLQGIVVGAMPLVIAIALLIVDPGLMKPFLYSLTGLAVMSVVAVLVGLGAFFIRKIINIDV